MHNKDVRHVGDESNDDENDVDNVDGRAYTKKCKEVARLQAQILKHMRLLATRWTRLHKEGLIMQWRVSTKYLTVKILALANMFKKKIAGHQDLVKDISLERKENEDILKQTTMSFGL